MDAFGSDAATMALARAGVGVLLHVTPVLILGLIAGRALRAYGPAAQSAAYRGALAAVAAVAVLSVLSSGRLPALWRIGLPTPLHSSLETVAPRLPADVLVLLRAHDGALGTLPPLWLPGTASAAWAGPAYTIGASVWLMGAAALLAWLALALAAVRRLLRRSLPVVEGYNAGLLHDLCCAHNVPTPPLRASCEVQSPFVAGLRRPAIFLPLSHEADLSDAAARAVLAHELAHIVRRDGGWNLLARVTGAALWLHPLVWMLCRRLEQAAEEACDRDALARGADRRVYAECLLAFSQRPTPILGGAVVVGAAQFRSSLGRRIQRLLGDASRPPRPAPRHLETRIGLGATGTVAASLLLVSAAAPSSPNVHARVLMIAGTSHLIEPALPRIPRIVIRKLPPDTEVRPRVLLSQTGRLILIRTSPDAPATPDRRSIRAVRIQLPAKDLPHSHEQPLAF